MAKIQSDQEVLQWFAEGRTYAWMSEQYLLKYNIEISPSAWTSFRRRHGLERRQTRDTNLIPWHVEARHRYAWPVMMLRAEARQRAGKELKSGEADELKAWKAGLEADDAVVHYEPDTKQGFFMVSRRPGIDKDLIREPGKKTGRAARD